MLMNRDHATLLVVDVQSKLVPAVVAPEALLERCEWLLRVAVDAGLPVVFSEQYPQGLGETDARLLAAVPSPQVVQKRAFSCLAEDCLPAALLARDQVIVCGMEAHVCVLQTVLELRQAGKQVFVVSDAVSSRSAQDRELALQRMRDGGAVVVSAEMVLFEMLRTSAHERFRHFSKTYLV
ncbi:isochorismatase hydrolase [Alcanivorax hongdengensis A-11-3]|uniref:Isochorismatase hydrolase n=1 Tax=Alcanivorax hongdengensis A-11-3 TaxID=1177179 RepID=L0WFY0_9GAMM|nr:hydrolase [Alcanivorax hongdengensis]EKF75758.1 isochorismatase hydrolase [Alcanivorax hongdengensis A-11-3]